MTRLRTFVARVRGWLLGRRLDRELHEEISGHLEEATEELQRQGLSAGEARRVARLRFGGVTQTRETWRAARSFGWVDRLSRTTGYAIRLGLRHKIGTLTTIVTLALGLGVTLATVGLVDGLLFKPPRGIHQPANVLRIGLVGHRPDGPSYEGLPFTYDQFHDFAAIQTPFADTASFYKVQLPAQVGDELDRVVVEVVSGSYFRLLGVTMALGRPLLPSDDDAAAPVVAVISHAYWRTTFNAGPAVLGQTLRLRDYPVTIVGVAPDEFRGTQFEFLPNPSVWTALHGHTNIVGAGRLPSRFPWLFGLGRLADGVDAEAAATLVNPAFRAVTVLPDDPYQFEAIGLERLSRTGPGMRERLRPLFTVLLVIASTVLLAACFNAINFFLGRGPSRRREMAIRVALGATRGELMRQLLVEALLLGGVAGVLAMLVSLWFGEVFANVGRIFAFQEVSFTPEFDSRIVVAGIVLVVCASLLSGGLPAWLTARAGANARLAFLSRPLQPGTSHPGTRQVVLAVQCGLAVLLAGTALHYGGSFRQLQNVPLGFSPDRILLLRVDPFAVPAEQREQVMQGLLPALEALPGVEAVGSSSWPPLSTVIGTMEVQPEGVQGFREVPSLTVGLGFFDAYDIPLLTGDVYRQTSDLETGVVVNSYLAEALWPDEHAIGRVLQTRTTSGTNLASRRVLGVVKLDRCNEILAEAGPCVFTPVSYSQGARLAVRARGNPEDLANPARGAIASVDRRLLVDEVRSFETYLSEVTGREHTTAYLTATLALVGVVLVGVGCALLASSLVAERRGELALRMALGATRGRLFGEVVRRGLLVGGVGVVAGGAATWLFQDFVQRRLFEAGAMSSGSVGIAALTVLAVAVVFTGLPAARLNHVAPSEALKQQSLG